MDFWFRRWHYKTNGQSLWKSFEVMNEMFISIVFVCKLSLSICIVALSSLYSKLRFSPVLLSHCRIIEEAFSNVRLTTNAKVYERAISSVVLRLFICKE